MLEVETKECATYGEFSFEIKGKGEEHTNACNARNITCRMQTRCTVEVPGEHGTMSRQLWGLRRAESMVCLLITIKSDG